jgi:hypothetical protein
MSWARRLKRVFGVEIESCTRCGGELKIIASIEEPQLIAKILSHLERAAPDLVARQRPKALRRSLPVAQIAQASHAAPKLVQHKAGYAPQGLAHRDGRTWFGLVV